MKIEFINEVAAIFKPSEQDNSDFKIEDIVKCALSVKDNKPETAVTFLKEMPYSFVKNFKDRIFFVEEEGNYLGQMHYGDLLFPLNQKAPKFLSKISDYIYPENNHSGIEYLDCFTIDDEALGSETVYPYEPCEPYVVTADNILERIVDLTDKGYAVICLRFLSNLIMRIQTLVGYAAMGNGQKSDIQISENILGANGEAIAKYVKIPFREFVSRSTPVQHPQCGQLFEESVLWQVAQSLELLGYKWSGNSLRIGSRAINPASWTPKGYFLDDSSNEVFVYPLDMSEREIAANILTSFLNNSHPEDMRYGDVLSFDGSGFKKKDAHSSEAALDNEIARLAVSDLVLLCPKCNHPFVRGDGRKHCTTSCRVGIYNQRKQNLREKI